MRNRVKADKNRFEHRDKKYVFKVYKHMQCLLTEWV